MQYIHAVFNTYTYAHVGSLMPARSTRRLPTATPRRRRPGPRPAPLPTCGPPPPPPNIPGAPTGRRPRPAAAGKADRLGGEDHWQSPGAVKVPVIEGRWVPEPGSDWDEKCRRREWSQSRSQSRCQCALAASAQTWLLRVPGQPCTLAAAP